MTKRAKRQSNRQIGTIGTLARLGVGVAFLVLAFAVVLHDGVAWYEGLAGFVAFPLALVALHAVVARVIGREFAATGGAGFCLNLALGAVLFSLDATRELTALFAGSSLLLAGVRGYGGCEVLAVSNFVLRRQDQVGCVVFSPLDEGEVRRGRGGTASRLSTPEIRLWPVTFRTGAGSTRRID